MSLAAVNQILCNSRGYERLQKSKDFMEGLVRKCKYMCMRSVASTLIDCTILRTCIDISKTATVFDKWLGAQPKNIWTIMNVNRQRDSKFILKY